MRLGRRITVYTLGLVALVAMAAPASAGQRFPTEVTLDYDDGQPRLGKRVASFYGEVSSPRPACIPKRKVVLYHRKHVHSKPIKVGADKTDSDAGVWSVETSAEEGFYFAKVKPRKISAGLCKPKSSLTLAFH